MLGELKEAGMVWSAAVKRAQDRNEWRNLEEVPRGTKRLSE